MKMSQISASTTPARGIICLANGIKSYIKRTIAGVPVCRICTIVILVAIVFATIFSCGDSRPVQSQGLYHWEEIQSPVNTFFRGVAWSESLNLFVAVGPNTILISHDGTSWARVDSLGTRHVGFRQLIWDGERFVVAIRAVTVNIDDSTLMHRDSSVVMYSSDGINWNRSQANKMYSIAGLAHSGQLYIGIGASNSSSTTASAIDSWTVNSLYLPPHHGLSTIVWADSFFIAGGDLGIIRTTTDGKNWITRYSGQPYKTPLSVVWSGSRVVMVGMDGLVIVSDDGMNWTVPETNLTSHLQCIKWTGERFVAVGDSGVVAVSTRGDRWTKLRTPTHESLRAIAFSNEVAVIVGGNGTILISRLR